MEGGTASAPTVALETAFLTTGLPSGQALETAERMAAAATARDVAPAFVGVLEGNAIIGLERDELELLARSQLKLATRDLPGAAAGSLTGGATVSATLFLAHRAGLQVAATGGIGGVHRGPGPPDVSADLLELSRTPMLLVCSGAKAILDLPATLERLETLGVTVVGFETNEFPGFWSRESGLKLTLRVEDAERAAELHRRARRLGTPGATLVCVPAPESAALAPEETEDALRRARQDLAAEGIRGPEVTPFLLARIAEYTEGSSVSANLAILENNAGVAAEIARALT